MSRLGGILCLVGMAVALPSCGKSSNKKDKGDENVPPVLGPMPVNKTCEEMRKIFVQDGLNTKFEFEQTEYTNLENRKNATVEGKIHFRETRCNENKDKDLARYNSGTVIDFEEIADFHIENGRRFLIQFSRSGEGRISVYATDKEKSGMELSATYYDTVKNMPDKAGIAVHPAVLAAIMEDLGFDALTIPETNLVSLFLLGNGKHLPFKTEKSSYLGDIIGNDKVYRTEIRSAHMSVKPSS